MPSDDEGDVDMDDVLPETLTQVGTITSSNERAAQLAADHMQVDSCLGLAEIKIRYPKRLSFLHVKDAYGDCKGSNAIALRPTEDRLGVSLESLEEGTMFQSGIYQNVVLLCTFMTMRWRARPGTAGRLLLQNITGQVARAHFAAKADSIPCLR